MHLSRFGRGETLYPVDRTRPKVDGVRVVYDHGNVSHWFVNSPLGLEQGFTIPHRPTGKGSVKVELDLYGDLSARVEGNDLVFVDQTERIKLRYGQLAAFDAEGNALAAELSLAGRRLTLAVNDTGASYPVIIDPLFTAETKLTTSDATPGSRSGWSVAVDGNTAVVGTPFDDVGASDTGSAYVFVRAAGTWSLQAKLTASDAQAGDRFGWAVTVSGDSAVIGAPFEDESISNQDTGSAYVFVRSDNNWVQQQKLRASDVGGATRFDLFGASVASDNDTTIIGAWKHVAQTVSGTLDAAGAAYVFMRTQGSWSEQQKLMASDAAEFDIFGRSVAVSGDTAIVGAPFLGSDMGNRDAGAAYVFMRNVATWSETQKLMASDAAAQVHLGGSVAVSGDTAVIGAYGDNNRTGAAYVFVHSAGSWSEQQKLTASDAMANGLFGGSVALDGDTALIGTYGDTTRAGAAYLFGRSAGSWSEQQELTASDAVANGLFGGSVALDGAVAAIGAIGHENNKGAVYIIDSPVDLSLVKQDSPDPVLRDDNLTYSLLVTNNDAEVDATRVTVTDALPAGVAFVSASLGCGQSAGTVICDLGTVTPGQMQQASITVRAETAGKVTNTASVSADQPDPDTNNNIGSELTTINIPPVANAGEDQIVNAGATVILDGTGSSDPDGTITTYAWTQIAGPAVSLSGADSATASFTAPGVTETTVLSFELTVTDDRVATTSDTVDITVNLQNTTINDDGVPIDLGSGVTITFTDVTVSGHTTVTTSGTNPGPASNFAFLGTFYGLSTTAQYQESLELCFTYDEAALPPGQDESTLQILYLELGTWVQVPETGLVRDPLNDTICATVSSLSWFAIAFDNASPTFTLQRLRDTLWPPNHKLVHVATARQVIDAIDPSPSVNIQVTFRDVVIGKDKYTDKDKKKHNHKHKQKDNHTSKDTDSEKKGKKDKNHRPAWEVRQQGSTWEIWLRAERLGKHSGRIYTIAITVTDASGNTTTDSHTVTVPHDQGKH